MKTEIYPISIRQQIVTQIVENEIFIYELNTNKVWCLNETCSFVWKMCDGTNDVREITKAISTEFKVNTDESIVWLTLDSFNKAGLLENGEEVMRSAEKKFSRREAIKKVGLTTMLALPIISTVIAPTAAQAQSSCIPFGGVCNFDNFTQSNCCNTNARCRQFIVGLYTCVGCDSGHQVKLCGSVGCCNGIVEANRCCNGPIIEQELFDSPGQYWCICP